jgi:hypothetical protein
VWRGSDGATSIAGGERGRWVVEEEPHVALLGGIRCREEEDDKAVAR